jgi:hypothetical protein
MNRNDLLGNVYALGLSKPPTRIRLLVISSTHLFRHDVESCSTRGACHLPQREQRTTRGARAGALRPAAQSRQPSRELEHCANRCRL